MVNFSDLVQGEVIRYAEQGRWILKSAFSCVEPSGDFKMYVSVPRSFWGAVMFSTVKAN